MYTALYGARLHCINSATQEDLTGQLEERVCEPASEANAKEGSRTQTKFRQADIPKFKCLAKVWLRKS
jgi:hypothetical protein